MRNPRSFANPVVPWWESESLKTEAARVMSDTETCADCGKRLHGYGATLELLRYPGRKRPWYCLSCMVRLCEAWQ